MWNLLEFRPSFAMRIFAWHRYWHSACCMTNCAEIRGDIVQDYFCSNGFAQMSPRCLHSDIRKESDLNCRVRRVDLEFCVHNFAVVILHFAHSFVEVTRDIIVNIWRIRRKRCVHNCWIILRTRVCQILQGLRFNFCMSISLTNVAGILSADICKVSSEVHDADFCMTRCWHSACCMTNLVEIADFA